MYHDIALLNYFISKLGHESKAYHDIYQSMNNTFQYIAYKTTIKKMKGTFKTIIDSEILVLIDFYADWCGPCKMLAPILEQVKDELGEEIKIVKIDVDKNQSIAKKYQVRGVPTMLLFKKGKLLWKQSGVLQKTEILSVINSFN